MNYHDNKVRLKLRNGKLTQDSNGDYGYFKITELSITSGQDPNEKNKVGNMYKVNSDGELCFCVGRKGSSEVARWWSERIDKRSTTFDHDPDDLNFAFIGELVLNVKTEDETVNGTITLKNVGLAQGHAGAYNNWWFGGKGMYNVGSHTVVGEDQYGVIGIDACRGDNEVNEVIVGFRTYIPWISKLSDETYVCQMSIPGTHDSGTSHLLGINKGPAHCQNLGIAEQLNDGIRFFDIRFGYTLNMKHTVWSADTFNETMDIFRNFLKINPKEFIIMLVGSEAPESKWNLNMKDAIMFYEDLYLDNFNPLELQIKDVRGKILLLKRQDECPRGKLLRFSDNVTFEYEDFKVEDVYKEYNTQEKIKLVKANLGLAKNDCNRSNFFITFNSIAWGAGHHTPYQYACGGLGINPAMNEALSEYLAENPGKHSWGVIMLDFYNEHGDKPQPVKDIINSNFETPLIK